MRFSTKAKQIPHCSNYVVAKWLHKDRIGTINSLKKYNVMRLSTLPKDKYYDRREKIPIDDGFGDEASFARFSQNIMAKREETSRIEWTMNNYSLTVFFDGGCKLCKKEISHYVNLQNKHHGKYDNHHLVEFYDIYKNDLHPELERRKITYDDTQRRMHVLTSDGEIIHGFDAFLEIWKRMVYWEYLYIVCKMWPVRVFGEKIYTYWAKKRYDFRKNTLDKSSKCSL